MKIANEVRTRTHVISVGTSESDGHMYLELRDDYGAYSLKLTEENRDALRKVLGPTDTWSGIL